uniref:Uncharacterized protein n=1 Tax=Panagrolaimus davidi TaxID=227884 RepID=A0A914QYA9_9BILA
MSAPDFMINRNNGKSYYALAQNVERDVIVLAIYDKEDPKNPDAIHFISDKTFIDGLSQALDHRFIGVVIHLFEYNPPNYKNSTLLRCSK